MLHKFLDAKVVLIGTKHNIPPGNYSVNITQIVFLLRSEYTLAYELGKDNTVHNVVFYTEADAIAAEKEVIMLSRHALQD